MRKGKETRDEAQAQTDAIKREVNKEGKEAHRGTMT